jgi:hypothetical protein
VSGSQSLFGASAVASRAPASAGGEAGDCDELQAAVARIRKRAERTPSSYTGFDDRHVKRFFDVL